MAGHAWSSLQDHCGHTRHVKQAADDEGGGAVCEIVNVFVTAPHRSRGVPGVELVACGIRPNARRLGGQSQRRPKRLPSAAVRPGAGALSCATTY